MGRRIAIGLAWWVATAYALAFATFMYGLPPGFGAIVATAIAFAIAATRPAPRRRPADLRRIYQPSPEPGVAAEPATVAGR